MIYLFILFFMLVTSSFKDGFTATANTTTKGDKKMIGKDFLKEFKSYVGNFEFDLIIVSAERMAIIHQTNNQYIELNNGLMMRDIIEYLISTNDSLTDMFDGCMVRFSTDDYLKHYLKQYSYQQVV